MRALRVVHDGPMKSRTVVTAVIASIVLAACGGGDSDGGGTTLSEITLLTTTTEAPLFDDVDAETTVAEPEVGTTLEASTTTVAAPVTEVTTPPATEATPSETTAAEQPVETAPDLIGGEFVLGADGLGAVRFGGDAEQTIAYVTSVFGTPTADTGWVDPFEIGPCGGTRLRQVNWNELQLEFGDVSDVMNGRDHFYSYFYGVEGSSTPQPAGLATAEDIGAGSTIAELIAAYPAVVLLQGDDFVGPSFTINTNLTGRLSGITDTDVVQAVIGGRPCDG